MINDFRFSRIQISGKGLIFIVQFIVARKIDSIYTENASYAKI